MPFEHRDRGRVNGGARPQGVDADPTAKLPCHTQYHHAHAELRHRVGHVRRKPALLHLQRRGDRQQMRVGGLQQMRQGLLRHQEAAAGIDRVHQVKALERRGEDRRQVDRAGIVDADVDAAKARYRRRHGGVDLFFEADIAQQRQRMPTGRFDLRGRGVDRARQDRVRQVGLGGDCHVGPVLGRPQRNRQANAARGATDKKGLAAQRAHRQSVARRQLQRERMRSGFTGRSRPGRGTEDRHMPQHPRLQKGGGIITGAPG